MNQSKRSTRRLIIETSERYLYYSKLVNNYSYLLNKTMIAKNTAKIMLHLLKHIDEIGLNVNQISRTLSISVGSAFKILKTLENDGIVFQRKISNSIHYRLDLENPEAMKICELLLLIERRNLPDYAKVYADEISKEKSSRMIILFGSILNGKDFNDVDVLFMSDKTNEVKDFCLELTKIRTKPIVPLILQREGIIQELQRKNKAILSLMQEGIVLRGETEYIEIIKDVNP